MARLSLQQKLGKKLKAYREDSGLTQDKLGELTGLDRSYISDIERGARNPGLKNIERLAKALGIKISDLTNF